MPVDGMRADGDGVGDASGGSRIACNDSAADKKTFASSEFYNECGLVTGSLLAPNREKGINSLSSSLE